MKQQNFENKYRAQWDVFSEILNTKDKKIKKSLLSKKTQQHSSVAVQNSESASLSNTEQHYAFVSLYRMTCQHYSIAKQRHYSPKLVNELHELVVEGHQQLYDRKGNFWLGIYEFFAYVFPIRLRQHAPLFWISFSFFTIPLVLMGLACFFDETMIYSVMSPHQVMNMESMYDPANAIMGRESSRQSDTDIMMFGHYIRNNIGIDFQVYAMGIFAGIGTLFSMVYNGVVIGAVAGHLTNLGFSETFWAFVCGHGSFELTAAVISGAAGLRLAQSLFMPGNLTRADSFKVAGKQSVEILIGAATMTFIAAFIEAFWSSSSMIVPEVKYIVALFLWALVIYYLTKAGRGYEYKVRDHAN